MRTVRFALLGSVALLAGSSAFAQSYNPVGPQANVSKATVEGGGWTLCHSSAYDAFTGEDLAEIQANCTGDKLMLACSPVRAGTLTLLAQADRDDVFFDAGDDFDQSHLANGAQWYFNVGGVDGGANSWGFAAAGEAVNRSNCDIAAGTSPELRLCWHLQQDEGGYRCGSTVDLNDSTAWTKYVYSTGAAVPALSRGQLALVALLLAAAALAVLRQRGAQALPRR